MWDEESEGVGLRLSTRGGVKGFLIECSNDETESLKLLVTSISNRK